MLACGNSNEQMYKSLSEDIIRLFTENNNIEIQSINIRQQYKNIDIVVEVNDSDVIVIEDKVGSSPHSNQLIRYKEIIENDERYKNYNKHYIYYKIEDESLYNGVEQAKYKRITREDILSVIRKHIDLKNDLLNDYIKYLEGIEYDTKLYQEEQDINKWNWSTWKGYYSNLQHRKQLKFCCWDYVNNKSGGFLGFFWNWKNLKYISDNNEIEYELCLQIESNPSNEQNNKVRVAFKLKCENKDYRSEIRWYVYNCLKDIGNEHITKPIFGNGLYMTFAEIKDINTKEDLDNMVKLAEKVLEKLVSKIRHKYELSRNLIYNYIALYEDDKKYQSQWQEKGFVLSDNKEKYIWNEDIDSAIILEKKLEACDDFSKIIDKQIESVDDCIGSYGMGGLGYFGIKYKDNNDYKWLVIDCQQVDFFMDNRPFTTRTREEADKTPPWYRGYIYHPEKSRNQFFQFLESMTITDVTYGNNTLYISLKDEYGDEHKIHTLEKSVGEIYIIPDKSNIFI